jgi:hypothetical protein
LNVLSTIKLLLASTLAISTAAFWLLWKKNSRHPVMRFSRMAAATMLVTRIRTWLGRNRSVLILLTYWGPLLLAAGWINVVFAEGTQYRPCLSPDSGSYLGFSLIRPPLYPAIVQLTYLLTGDIRWLIPMQLNALLASLAVLGVTLARLSDCRFCGFAFTLLSFCLLPVLLLSYMILSEALFTVFLVLHFALVGLFIKTRSWHYAMLAGIAFACILLMRPAGLSVFVGLPFLVWLLRGEISKILLGIAFPAALTMVLAFNTSQSIGGLALVGHVAYLLDEKDAKGPFAELINDIVVRTSHITRPLRQAEFPYDLWARTTDHYNEVLYGYTVPAIEHFLKAKHGRQVSLPEISDTAIAISMIAIKNHSRSYTKHVLANYYGAWQGVLVNYGSVSSSTYSCYTGMQKMPQEAKSIFASATDIGYLGDPDVARRFAERKSKETLLYHAWREINSRGHSLRQAAFAFSLVLILAGLFHLRDSLVILLCYASLQLNAYFGFLSSIAATIERYSVPFTPILLLVLFGTIALGARWAIRLGMRWRLLK